MIGQANDGPPYRLEVPRAVCPVRQLSFDPAMFLTAGARDYLRLLATTWRTSDPDVDDLNVSWFELDHPHSSPSTVRRLDFAHQKY